MGHSFEVEAQRFPELTPREREIMSFLLTGLTSKEIAGIFEISSRTVEAHRISIMLKLGLHRPIQMMNEWHIRQLETPDQALTLKRVKFANLKLKEKQALKIRRHKLPADYGVTESVLHVPQSEDEHVVPSWIRIKRHLGLAYAEIEKVDGKP